MLLPRFEYRHATSLLQATTLLAEHPDARPLAGGTDLLVDLRERRRAPRLLVDISELPELRGVAVEGDELRIGGGVTVADLLAAPAVAERLPALRAAARDFADYLTRNKATLGGNLANASPGADLVVPLLALDARVTLAGPGGERTLALDAFLLGPRRTALGPGELVRCVTVPVGGGRQFWYKLGLKRGGAIAVVSVATRLVLDGTGGCTAARVALGAVGPRPFRAAEAEAAIAGGPLDPDRVGRAAELAATAAQPITDVRGGADYRRAMVRALVARGLAGGGPGRRAHGGDDPQRNPHPGAGGAPRDPPRRPPAAPRRHRGEVGLRAGRLRGLCGHPRREGDQLLSRPRRPGGRPIGHHGAGAGFAGRSAPAPGGVR